MIAIIDNYDSFTYNLVQYVGEVSAGSEIRVFRNDAVSVEELAELAPSHIIISPGPCTPNESGVSLAVIKYFKEKVPVCGVCLGHEAIAQSFGASIVRAKNVLHGKTSAVYHNEQGLFEGLPNPFTATRYHSLIVDKATIPECLQVTAWTAEDEIMGLAHRDTPTLVGVQFHPESIMTPVGKRILSRFLSF